MLSWGRHSVCFHRDGFSDEGRPRDDATYFERLAANVARIARYPHFPDRQQAVDWCLKDIDDLSLAGRITAEQAGALRETLLGSLGRAAQAAPSMERRD